MVVGVVAQGPELPALAAEAASCSPLLGWLVLGFLSTGALHTAYLLFRVSHPCPSLSLPQKSTIKRSPSKAPYPETGSRHSLQEETPVKQAQGPGASSLPNSISGYPPPPIRPSGYGP